jgi:transcriptional regulator with XRE-family HTH domain
VVKSVAHKVACGRRLRIAIEAKGLSQAQVCRELKESTTKLGNWLRGDNYPEPWFLTRFCDRYGVTTDWIYRGVVSGASESVAAALWKAEQETPEA